MTLPSLPESGRRSILFIDNGAYHIKAMYIPAKRHPSFPLHPPATGTSSSTGLGAGEEGAAPVFLTLPHCIGASPYAGRGLVGGEVLRHLPHYHSLLLRRPLSRRGGFLSDGIAEAHVWEHILEQFSINEEKEIDLWLTVPFGAPKAVARLLHALLTERFHFASLTLISSTFLSLVAAAGTPGARFPVSGGSGVVVDVGFSATTVVPYLDFLPVTTSILRLDVAGKLLTNRLKEYLSFTQMHLMEDEWLVNRIKESCCFVAVNPKRLYRLYARPDVTAFMNRCKEKGKAPRLVQHPLYAFSTDLPPLVQVYYLPSAPFLLPLGGTAEEVRAQFRVANSSTESPKSVSLAMDSKDKDVGREEGRGGEQGSEISTTTSLAHKKRSRDEEGTSEERYRKEEQEREQQLQILPQLFLQQECMNIPELLFTPGNIGIPQCGVAEAVGVGVFSRGLLASLPLLHPSHSPSPSLIDRVIVFGGSSNFPMFMERLEQDLQTYGSTASDPAPADFSGQPHKESAGLVRPSYFSLGNSPTSVPHFLDSESSGGGSSGASPNAAFPLSEAELQPLKGAYFLLCDTRFAAQRAMVSSHSSLIFYPSSSTSSTSPVTVEDVLDRLERLW